MRWVTLLTKLLVTLFGVIAVVYALLPWWMPAALQQFLPDSIELRGLELERPGGNHLAVPWARISLDIGQKEKVELSFDGIDVHYELRQLLAGRIQSIRIERLYVKLPEHYAPTNTSPSSSPQSLHDFLPATVFNKMPLDVFEIQSLSLKRPAYPQFDAWQGRAQLSNGVINVSINSGLQDSREASAAGWLIEGQVDKNNEVTVLARNNDEDVLALSSRIDGTAQGSVQLRGESRVLTAPLSELLKDLALLDPALDMEGTVQSEWFIAMPSKLDQLNAKNVTLSGSVAGKLYVTDARFGQLSCGLSNPLRHPTVPALVQFEWVADQLTLNKLNIACDGAIRSKVLPAALSDIGLRKDLTFTSSFSNDAALGLAMTKRRAALRSGRFDIEYSTQAATRKQGPAEGNLSGSLSITDGYFQPASGTSAATAKFGLQTEAALGNISVLPYSVRRLQLTAKSELVLEDSAAQLTLAPGAKASAKRVRWLNGGTANLQLKNVAPLSFSAAGSSFQMGGANLLLSGAPIHAFGPRLEYKALRLTSRGIRVQPGTGSSKNGVSSLSSDTQFFGNLDLSGDGMLASYKELKTREMQLRVAMTSKGLELQGTLSIAPGAKITAEDIGVSAKFQHNIKSNRGQAAIRTPKMAFDESNTFLPRLVQNWPYPLDFSAGALLFESTLNWQRGVASSRSRLEFDDLGGFYERNLFYGTNGALIATFENDRFEVQSEQLSVTNVEAGTSIENIELDLRPVTSADTALQRERVEGEHVKGERERGEQVGPATHIAQVTADVLGGRLSMKDVLLDPRQSEYAFRVDLEALKLEQLLQLESGVSGSGVLDAQLPFVISSKGISMSNGRVNGRDPGGVIRYQGELPKAALESNPQLGLALNALKNFHYAVLDMETTYTKNGKLTLKTRLEGRNPELQNSRPIHFNLNITEDIPALLKSLQLSQNISDKLNARIQQLSQ